VFVVLVRKDICPNQAVAQNIGEMVSKVIPHAFDSPHGGQADRETVQQLMAYNRAVLSDLGREPTSPLHPRTGVAGVSKIGSLPGSFGFLVLK
jgi:hypothetical protein